MMLCAEAIRTSSTLVSQLCHLFTSVLLSRISTLISVSIYVTGLYDILAHPALHQPILHVIHNNFGIVALSSAQFFPSSFTELLLSYF